MKQQKTLKEIAIYLLTDGGLSRHQTSYVIYFTNKSAILHEEFKSLIRQVTTPDQHFGKQNILGVLRTRCYHNKLARELLKLSPTYRTTPCYSYPKCGRLRGKPENQPCTKCQPINGKYPPARIPPVDDIRQALRIIAATEGSVRFHLYYYPKYVAIKRSVTIGCEHPTLKRQIAELLQHFNISSRNERNLLRIDGYDVEKFYRKIGFPRGVKQNQGAFKGIDKQAILELMIITNQLIKKKQFFPGRIVHLKKLLKKCALMIQENKQQEVIELLT